jgi:hypothetical protein
MKSLIFLACMQGVRHLENLSSFLFSIFVNDLEDYFEELNALPLGTAKNVKYNILQKKKYNDIKA